MRRLSRRRWWFANQANRQLIKAPIFLAEPLEARRLLSSTLPSRLTDLPVAAQPTVVYSPAFIHPASQTTTTTVVTSSNAAASYEQPVTFTATVTPAGGSGETGTVQFQIDGGNIGSPITLSGMPPIPFRD